MILVVVGPDEFDQDGLFETQMVLETEPDTIFVTNSLRGVGKLLVKYCLEHNRSFVFFNQRSDLYPDDAEVHQLVNVIRSATKGLVFFRPGDQRTLRVMARLKTSNIPVVTVRC